MSCLQLGAFAPVTGTWAPLPVPDRVFSRRLSPTRGSCHQSGWRLPLCPAAAAACCARAAARGHSSRKRLGKHARRVLQPYAIEPINSYLAEMKLTVQRLAERGSGLLDASQTPEELEGLLKKAGAKGSEEGRRAWRELLCATEGLGRFCSCVVFEDEALRQSASDGRTFVDILQEQDVIVGVRVDTGYYPLNAYGEKGTDGYADLNARCLEYYRCGVRLAKWRLQVLCTMEMPTDVAVWENTTRLAQAARACQANGLAFAGEIEVVMGPGNHSMERTAYVAEKVYSQAMRMMNEYDVTLEAAVLITGACAAGPEAGPVRQDDAAEFTVRCLRRTAPLALGGVHISPSEDSNPEMAARNVRAVQEASVGAPWVPMPVYTQSLLAPVLAAWVREDDSKELWDASARSTLVRLLEASSQSQVGMSEEDTLPPGKEGA
uniref:fructose-bisphosphate aldolase n=1 Tax=Alexandrium catenella TaxID=2925 RepID=A0A7S1WR07_ALECA|mmetsp:Transcript_82573/g.219169  ORF Transcript_82573/g.219169 Transcript_82573/m.219169 type:complete len:435 (+) Transcript_82573:67-1371(+)